MAKEKIEHKTISLRIPVKLLNELDRHLSKNVFGKRNPWIVHAIVKMFNESTVGEKINNE